MAKSAQLYQGNVPNSDQVQLDAVITHHQIPISEFKITSKNQNGK
ncbi:hypothetical protein BVRB_6g127830 [Beta vulgaris subsp. vulgaris]|nr:hypothetical protein BVRB_6g127830 [Beta vulgaris subsp. vulgaris]